MNLICTAIFLRGGGGGGGGWREPVRIYKISDEIKNVV